MNGAITSFLAGALMVGGNFEYLHKFGIFMMVTILSSVLVTYFFFPAILFIAGPEGTQGDLYVNIINPVKQRLRRIRQP